MMVLCHDRREAEAALASLAPILAEMGLTLKPVARWPSHEAMQRGRDRIRELTDRKRKRLRSKRSCRTSMTSCAAGRTTTATGTVARTSPRSEPNRPRGCFERATRRPRRVRKCSMSSANSEAEEAVEHGVHLFRDHERAEMPRADRPGDHEPRA